MSRRKMTDEQVAQAITWREAGRSVQWIANRLRTVSKGALSWLFLKEGVESPRTAGKVMQLRGKNAAGSVVRRGDHEVRRFSEQEDAELLRLAREGLGNSAIGRALVPRRARNVVAARLMTLARRDARREEAHVP